MKRIVLIITALFATATYAQDQLTQIVDRNGVACYDYSTFLNGMGDECYVCTDYTMLNSFTRICQDIITCVSKNGTEGRKIVVERSMDLNLLTFYEGESHIHCLYSTYDYSAKSYVIYLNSVPKDATTGAWNPEKIISFKMERREDIMVGAAVSPDQTKASIVIFQVNKAGFFQSDRSDKLKGSGVLTFGDEGLIWTNPLELDFPNSTISVFDLAISNKANTYVAISSFNQAKGSNAKENETLHLFEVGAEETRTAEIQPDFGNLRNGKLLLCASGDIALGGYYQEDSKQKVSGAYIVTFDGKTMESGSFSTQPFPQDYYDYKHSKFSKKGEDFNAVTVDFKEFSNGTKVLLGEARLDVESYPYSYTLFGNTLISFADKNNQLDEFQMIYKNQSIANSINRSTKYYQSFMLCFNTIMHNDQLYLFYNDNLANYTGKPGQPFDVANTNYKKKCGLYCTIDGDHRISEPVMYMNYEKNKTVIYRPLAIDEDGLLIYNSSGLYGAVSKLRYQF